MSIDASSPAWLAIAAALRERIEEHKEKCCSIHASAEARAGYAARIDELRQILSLGDAGKRPRVTANRSETY